MGTSNFARSASERSEPLYNVYYITLKYIMNTNLEHYAITLKENRQRIIPQEATYSPILEALQTRGVNIRRRAYELDSHGRLHCHFYAIARKGFLWSRSIPKGMHRDVKVLDKLSERKAWDWYLQKPDLAAYAFIDEELEYFPNLILE